MSELKDKMEKFQMSTSDKVSIFVAEFLGTGILVFVSCLGATTSDLGLFQPSLVAGLAVMMVIHLFGHISGAYVNPVTTLGAFIMGQIDLILGGIYFCAQIFGAVAGFSLLKLILPEKYISNDEPHIHGPGMTLPINHDVSTLQVFSIELTITTILTFANCASWDKRVENLKDSLALRFGFLVAALNFIAVPFTGCSMNPARSFGPALLYNDWTLHWVYWIAPMTAAILGSVIYKFLLNKKEERNCIY